MTETIVVPEVITKDLVLSWSGAEMLKRMKDPQTREAIEQAFNEPDPDPAAEAAEVEAAKAAEALRFAEEVTAQLKAAEEAKAAETAVIQPQVLKKLIVEYQATDAVTGAKIGRPTHLETSYIDGDKDSEIAAYREMSEKQRIAHVNATQALENLKKQKVTIKKEEPAQIGLTEAEVKQLASELDEDPVKAQKKADAVRKLSGAEAAEQREREAQLEKEKAIVQRETYSFMGNHLQDFYPCQANSDILTAYITDNKLEWTRDNLEIAFAATESQLAPVPRSAAIVPQAQAPVVSPVAPAVIAQAPPVAPVVEQPVAPAVPSVVTAPVEVQIAEPANPVLQQRRVPNGGIQPGTMSGRPPAPSAVTPALTKRDILKMPRDEYKQKIRDPKFRALVEQIFNQK